MNALLGFGIGAAVVLVNCWAIGATVRMLLHPEVRARGLLAALGLGSRLLAIGLVVGFSLRYLPVSPIAMVLGVSVVPIAVLARALMGVTTLRQG